VTSPVKRKRRTRTEVEEIVQAAYEELAELHPMTLRQAHYRLVGRGDTTYRNTQGDYKQLSVWLRDARLSGRIPWEWVEDRLRRPRRVSMWSGLPDFVAAVGRSYRREVWDDQPEYLEVVVEKDALSGIFEGVLDPYGVTLNVGRGYDGWSSIKAAAGRYGHGEGVSVLYFGDFDPSGEDMVRSLHDRLAELGCFPEIVKCALAFEDIEEYDLPPDPTKAKDSRREAFVERYGDVAVELDALPPAVLRDRIEREVRLRMDLEALERTRRVESEERRRLDDLLDSLED
jgi:hypothetical protein